MHLCACCSFFQYESLIRLQAPPTHHHQHPHLSFQATLAVGRNLVITLTKDRKDDKAYPYLLVRKGQVKQHNRIQSPSPANSSTLTTPA
jgi:hypothetical protein